MEHLTSRDLRRLLKFLHELYALRDKPSFVSHIISALPSLIPSEVASYNDLDAKTETAAYEVWPTSFILRPDSAEILGRFADQIPAVSYWTRTQKSDVKKNTDFLALSEFRRTDIFNEFYAPHRIPYTFGIPLTISQTQITALAQHRDRKDFGERDRSLLETIHPHLVQAYANAQAISRMNQEMAARDCALDQLNRGIVSVTARGKIQWATQTGLLFLQRYFPAGPRGNSDLPDTLLGWMRRGRSMDGVHTLTIQQGERSLRVRFVPERAGGLLLLDECCERFPRKELQDRGLTGREVEVLNWVSQGKTNGEIAQILSVSVRTVHKHVERIFVKLGVENRSTATAMVHELMRM